MSPEPTVIGVGERRFTSTWWSIQVPDSWNSMENADCVSFVAIVPVGVLQISAVRKEDGHVTDEDIREFAAERLSEDRCSAALTDIDLKHVSGIHVSYTKDDVRWEEWWLRYGHTMVYATYNASLANHSQQEIQAEIGTVQTMVDSLSVTDNG